MADKGKNKGGFLKGLGTGLIVMSAPLFFKALAGQDKIEAARSINPARAAAMQDSANLSMTLGVLLLVGGLAAIIIGIAKGSRNKGKDSLGGGQDLPGQGPAPDDRNTAQPLRSPSPAAQLSAREEQAPAAEAPQGNIPAPAGQAPAAEATQGNIPAPAGQAPATEATQGNIPARDSRKPEGNGEAVPERIKVVVPSSWKSVVPTILAVLFGLALVAVIIRDNRIIKDKDAWISSLNDQIYDKQETIDDLKDELEEAKTKMSDMQDNEKNLESALAKLPPLLITDLQMGVTNNERDIMVPHGNTIYSSETMFLSPSISYYGIRSEEVELHMKLFTPSGRMAYNVSESPSGFTNKTSFWTFKGENTRILNGWGKNVRGNWSAGSYRIEIWYGSTCLYSKDFEVF